jgi:hypothetical protein
MYTNKPAYIPNMPAFCVCFITAFCILFSSCKKENEVEEETRAYSIGGIVSLSDGGSAAGASIVLVKTSDESVAGETVCSSTGEYIISGIIAGNYKLSAALSGYETGSTEGIAVDGKDLTVDEIVLKKITAPTYSVKGAITKPDGSPAAGATVQLIRNSDNINISQPATTDNSGKYTVNNVPAGDYTIIASLNGFDTGIINSIIVLNVDLDGINIALKDVAIDTNAILINYSDNNATISNLPADGSITVSQSGADVTIATSSTSFTNYAVTGSTHSGSLKIQNNVAASNTIRLTLNSATIVSASKLPPIQITKNEGAAIIELKGTNILADNATNEENAALISKSGSIEFEGFGNLRIEGLTKHAIASSKKSITVNGGEITVAAAASDGFHAENGFIISAGTLHINASGDGIDAGAGTAVVNGGNLIISSATNDVKGIKGDDGVMINGGIINMDIAGAQSKGISSKSNIEITSGNIEIITSGSAVLEPLGSGFDPSYCTAVKCDGDILISGGTIIIDSKKTADGGKGLSADGNIEISGGSLNISTAGDGKVYISETGLTDSYTATCIKSDKNIYLLGGNIYCSSTGAGGKCISADETIIAGKNNAPNSDLVIKASTSGERFYVSGNTSGGQPGRPADDNVDYANPKAIKSLGNMTINSGTISINCTQKTDGGEGLESKSTLTINGGNIDIHSFDDCINAENAIVINNGYLFLSASGNDAIDSNGSLTINGGMIIANGVRSDGEGLDSDKTIMINGGTILATSGSTMSKFSGTQKYCKLQAPAGSQICIKNAKNENILLFTIPIIAGASQGTNLVLIFSAPELATGSYTLITGGTISGGTTVNGYNTGGTYTGGTSKQFSI